VFIPQPPGGGVGAVGAVVVGLGAQEFPFQNVFIPQPPGGGVGPVGAGAVTGGAGAVTGGAGAVTIGAIGAVTVGAGPPLFSQDA
jgi:hypothetical protein